MPKRASVFWTLLLCLSCGLVAYVTPILILDPAARAWFNSNFLGEWLRLGHAMRLTATHYYEPENAAYERLGLHAMDGMVEHLDRYSEFLPPAAFDQFQQQTEQTYVGIGVAFEQLDGLPTVTRVYPQSGAAEAGILPGDQILAAEKTPLAEESLETIFQQLRGAAGTTIALEIRTPGTDAPRIVSVERRKISTDTVSARPLTADGIAHVRINEFESRTAEELRATLARLRAEGMQKLVLDLRGNPGGLVIAAVDTVSLFCPANTLVTTSQSRISSENHAYRTASLPPEFPSLPVVILVNRQSASAAEIVSGALQDLRRAVILGDRTFGKGVVQSIYKLDSTHALKITTARYVLPSGRSIQGSGVQPDIYQPMDRRVLTLRAIADTWAEIGRAGEFSSRFGPPPADTQLDAALDFLRALPPADPQP